jgi:hypothetical protein
VRRFSLVQVGLSSFFLIIAFRCFSVALDRCVALLYLWGRRSSVGLFGHKLLLVGCIGFVSLVVRGMISIAEDTTDIARFFSVAHVCQVIAGALKK